MSSLYQKSPHSPGFVLSLIVNDRRMVQVFRGRVIDEKAASIFHFPDYPAADRRRNSRTTEARTQGAEILHVLVTDISRPMQYDISFQSPIVVTLIHSVEVKGQTITAEISGLRHIKAKAAFKRFGLIGKGLRIFTAGILSVSNIGPVKQLLVL